MMPKEDIYGTYRTMSTWMNALKEYNAGKKWAIPKKGSDEYLAVMKLVAPKMPKLERTESAPPKAPKVPKNIIVEPVPVHVTAPKSRKKPVAMPEPEHVVPVMAPVEPIKKKVQRSKL
jgi:hypothetical protein